MRTLPVHFRCKKTALLAAALVFLTSADTFPSENNIDTPNLSQQSQSFWQQEATSAAAANATPTPPRLPTLRAGRFATAVDEEESLRRFYRQTIGAMLRQELPGHVAEHRERILHSLEEEVSDGARACLPSLLVTSLPANLINACEFQTEDRPDQFATKASLLGMRIIGAPLLMAPAEKNKLAGLAFCVGAERALSMQEHVPIEQKCDYYLSVAQLFHWAGHRYPTAFAKRYTLNKAQRTLQLALESLPYAMVDNETRHKLGQKIIVESFATWAALQAVPL